MPEVLHKESETIWPHLPIISVIVLNYNTCEHLEACLSSLQQLIYPADKLELIVVDNASTDSSVAYVQAHFAGVKLIVNDQNYGFCRGNNIGAAKAKGDFIAFLNPDMRVEQGWLIELVKPLLAEVEVAATGSKILSWDGQTIDFAGGVANFYGYGFQPGRGQEAGTDFNQVKPTLFVCGGAMMVRRELFLAVDGFDEDFFAYYEDVDLGWRLWVLGYKVLFVPTSITYHHHHGAWGKVNDEKKRVLYERNAFFVMLKNYEDANLTIVLPVALLLLLKRTYLAAGIEHNLLRIDAPKSQPAPPVLLEDPTAVYSPPYYLKETWRTLTTNGPKHLYFKIKRELKQRKQARQQAKLPERMRLEQAPDRATIPLQTLSYLTAGNDIINLYEKMSQKREFIQGRRRRSDKEIAGLFGRPFGFSESWPEYRLAQNYLSHLFGIDKIFE